jgi:5-carboxymethyl-2-hydroxymuconate isomerase
VTLNAQQRIRNIRTKVRLISDRIWRIDGYGVCTGEMEKAFVRRELDLLAGLTPEAIPREASRALQARAGGVEK